MTEAIIRPATEAELRFVRSSWYQSYKIRRDQDTTPSQIGGVASWHMRWGSGRRIDLPSARRMHRLFVHDAARVETCLVAAVPTDESDTQGVAFAWVCREVLRDKEGEANGVIIHCAYTDKQARRRGLASMLLRYVHQEAKATHLPVTIGHVNRLGRLLLLSIEEKHDDRRSNLESPDDRPPMVAAQG